MKSLFMALALYVTLLHPQAGLQNRFMLAQSYEQIGEYQKAKPIYEELYAVQPDNFAFFQALNKTYVQLKEYRNSEALLQKKIEKDPDNVSFVALLGSTLYLNEREQEAFSLWENFVQKHKDDMMVYRALANTAIELRAFDKAIDLLQRAKALSEKNFFLGYDLAHLYAFKMDYKKSAEECVELLTVDEKQLPSVEARIFSYATRADILNAFISVFEDSKPEKNFAVGSILAKLYSANKEYEKAFTLYKKLDNAGAYKGSELFGFAVRVSGDKAYAKATEVFSYLLTKYPESPYAQSIKIYLAKNAEAELEDANTDSSGIWKTYPPQKFVSEKLYAEPLSIYKETAEKNPYSDVGAEAQYRLGYLYKEKIGDNNAAQPYFENIISMFTLSKFFADACMQLADMKLKNNNPNDALSFYAKIVSNPRTTDEQKNRAKFAKAKIEFFRGHFTEATQLLSQSSSVLSDNSSNDAMELSFLLTSAFNDSLTLCKFAEGDFNLLRQKPEKAGQMFLEIIKNESAPFLLRQIAEIRLIQTEISENKFSEALAQIDSVLKRDDKNIFADKAALLAARIYQYGIKNREKAIEAYQNLLLTFPGSLYGDKAREAINELRNKIS